MIGKLVKDSARVSQPRRGQLHITNLKRWSYIVQVSVTQLRTRLRWEMSLTKSNLYKLALRSDGGNYTCRVRGGGGRVAETSFLLSLIGENLHIHPLQIAFLIACWWCSHILYWTTKRLITVSWNSWAACGINWNSLRASRIGTRIFFLSQFARPPDRDSPIFFQSQLFSSIHRRLPAISNVFFKVPIELKTGELKKKKKGTYYFAIMYCMSTIFSPRSSSRVFESFVYCCKYFLP